MDTEDARGALADIAEARRETAQLSKAPPGYYSALGVAVALLLLAPAAPTKFQLGLIIASATLTVGSIIWYSKTVPTWGWGKVTQASSWPFWIMIGTASVSVSAVITTRSMPVAATCALITFFVFAILGPVWDRNYRQQLEATGE